MERISAVITAREESPEVLEITLAGLLAAGVPEIIVVDDGSLTPVHFKARGVSVIRNEQPLGVARSRRFGASFTESEVLVFCDAHMRFAPDCFERMLEHVDSGRCSARRGGITSSRGLCAGAGKSSGARPVITTPAILLASRSTISRASQATAP
jgi:glycosyltransferase involved in cell wall biosynthesis